MARITGGEVTYMERRKIGDYEHKEAKAILSFSLDEGDDHDSTLDTLTVTAKARVHEMLGLTTRQAGSPPTSAPKADVKPAAPAFAKGEAAPVKRGPGRPPKVEAAPVVEAVVEAEPVVEAAPAKLEVVAEPDVLDEFALEDEAPAIKKIVPDPVTEVTDAELVSAVTAKMKVTKNAMAIKDVMRKSLIAAGITNTTGKQLRDIPMPQRPSFLVSLGAI